MPHHCHSGEEQPLGHNSLFKDRGVHWRVTVLFYLIAFLREKAYAKKERADHKLSFSCPQRQFSSIIKMFRSFACTTSWPNILQPRGKVSCALGEYCAQLLHIATEHMPPTGLGRFWMRRHATSVRRSTTSRRVCIC